LAEEEIAVLLTRMQRSDRRSEHRSAVGRRRKEFWR
jgi:hypothetical protein